MAGPAFVRLAFLVLPSAIAVQLLAAGGENASRRHATQVRACMNSGGNVYVFVQHWHENNALILTGTITLRDDSTMAQSTLPPIAKIDDKLVSYLDSQCATGTSTSLITDCPQYSSLGYDDYLLFEFSLPGCSSSSTYTILDGNVWGLEEACAGLYPATVGGSVLCPATPSPTPSATPSSGGGGSTPSPTPSPGGGGPTPSPTPGSGGGGSAIGDPHLQNIHGDRFDLMKAGKHVLINIPRGMSAENALLRVQADAQRLGGQCTDMYFQEVNVTGSWADNRAKKTGGLRYHAQDVGDTRPHWMRLGPVQLKVAHGHTRQGIKYLNVYVKSLGLSGFAVGGLLGEDDHSKVEIPQEECARRLAM